MRRRKRGSCLIRRIGYIYMFVYADTCICNVCKHVCENMEYRYMCVYAYVCIYICICMYIYAYIYTCVHSYIHMHLMHIHIYTSIYIYVFIYVCMYIYVSYMHVCIICTYIHTFI